MDQLIPLTTAPNQTWPLTVTIDGNVVNLVIEIHYNSMAGYWWMQIQDTNGNILADLLPLITGSYPAANILGQLSYLGLGSAYILNLGQSLLDYPDNTNLGTAFILVWSDTANVL
jgi:hypothetical protein